MRVNKKKLKAFIAECVKEMAENKHISNNDAFIGKVSGYPVRIQVMIPAEALENYDFNVNDKIPKNLKIISD